MVTMIAAPPDPLLRVPRQAGAERRADDAYLARLGTDELVRLSLRYRALATRRALLPGEVARRVRIERRLAARDRDRR